MIILGFNRNKQMRNDNTRLELKDIMPYVHGVSKAGYGYRGTCPICGKEKHLYFRTNKNSGLLQLKCFRCGASGTEIFRYFRSIGVQHTP